MFNDSQFQIFTRFVTQRASNHAFLVLKLTLVFVPKSCPLNNLHCHYLFQKHPATNKIKHTRHTTQKPLKQTVNEIQNLWRKKSTWNQESLINYYPPTLHWASLIALDHEVPRPRTSRSSSGPIVWRTKRSFSQTNHRNVYYTKHSINGMTLTGIHCSGFSFTEGMSYIAL